MERGGQGLSLQAPDCGLLGTVWPAGGQAVVCVHASSGRGGYKRWPLGACVGSGPCPRVREGVQVQGGCPGVLGNVQTEAMPGIRNQGAV